MNVLLCGFHWTGCKALSLLVEQKHRVAVFTHAAPAHVPSLHQYAKSLGVFASLDDVSQSQLPFNPDVVASVYYRHRIKKHVIDACDGRIFNLHPALLPKYRGCSSLTWAMVQGESQVGFTYHYVDEEYDTGNIIIQESEPLEPYDLQATLFQRMMVKSMGRFMDAFDHVAAGRPGVPQRGEASYFRRGAPFDGVIDPTWADGTVERFIRAMNHPPYPPAQFAGVAVNTFEEYVALRNAGGGAAGTGPQLRTLR